jgi:hypothetical protein
LRHISFLEAGKFISRKRKEISAILIFVKVEFIFRLLRIVGIVNSEVYRAQKPLCFQDIEYLIADFNIPCRFINDFTRPIFLIDVSVVIFD